MRKILIILSIFFLTGCSHLESFFNPNEIVDEIDYKELTNKISLETMKCVVTIYAQVTSNGYVYYGSGIIFHESNGYYYALTNNHVTNVDENPYCYITNYLSEEVPASIVHQSASYDLSVVKFYKSSELDVITFADELPKINETIVSLGNPSGQKNTITYGEYRGLSKAPTVSDPNSNIEFNVMLHNAYLYHGSSGGALLNTDLELVGINYAGSMQNGAYSGYSYAVSISKVNEFLSLYVWDKINT